jgi:hypothetical protein
MLTKEVPSAIKMYPCTEEDTVFVDCGDGYCAVKRPYQAWAMGKSPDHNRQFNQFFNSTNKTEQLKDVIQKWQAEYAKFVQDGTLLAGPGYEPYYISNPNFFEEDISWAMQFDGELSPADRAWIKNTRELIEKYHAVFKEALKRIYPLGD